MLSKKLIASLGLDLKDVCSVPKALRRKTRKKNICIHDIYVPRKTQPLGESEDESLASYSSYEDSSHDSSYSGHAGDTDEEGDPTAWVRQYEEATKSQYDSQIDALEKGLEVLKGKTYGESFVDKLDQKDDVKKIEELEVAICKLKASFNTKTKKLVDVDHEECSHCGMVGMMQINVHRCIKHCMACHHESVVEHFYETTGSNLMTTNPGRYTRRGHFISTLKKIQAKRPVKLPPMLLGEVKKYLDIRLGVTEPKDVNYNDMKDILKDLGYNDKSNKGDFMEHIMAIYCQLTGRNPPRFTISENQTLITDFDKLDVTFEQACYELGVDRTNWLSYEFTIYKLCEKNKYNAMKGWFGILKGPLTLKSQDQIMGKMFELNHWEFKKTKPPSEEARREEEEGKTAIADIVDGGDTSVKKRARKCHQPNIIDMMSFMEHHKSFIPKPIHVLRIDEHLMSTDEEEEENDDVRKKNVKLKRVKWHQAKAKGVRKQKIQKVT